MNAATPNPVPGPSEMTIFVRKHNGIHDTICILFENNHREFVLTSILTFNSSTTNKTVKIMGITRLDYIVYSTCNYRI